MAYSFTVQTNNKLTENVVSGKKFDCSHLSILHKYKLADEYKIKEKIPVRF